MATVTDIPTSFGANTNPNYEIEVELDGVEFLLQLKFNSRQETWFMNILDLDGNILRAGISVVTGWALIIRWADIEVRPAGEFLPIVLAGVNDAAGLEQLGREVVLTYHGDL